VCFFVYFTLSDTLKSRNIASITLTDLPVRRVYALASIADEIIHIPIAVNIAIKGSRMSDMIFFMFVCCVCAYSLAIMRFIKFTCLYQINKVVIFTKL
jgi:hypothetical protein